MSVADERTDLETTGAGDIRPGEQGVALPAAFDAGVYFIGRIRTPFKTRAQCPRRGDAEEGPVCTIDLDPRWAAALEGVAQNTHLQVLYWMDQARRDLVLQSPRRDGTVTGTFAIRSPVRPNPIASSVVRLIGVEGTRVQVRGLDCLDGTPLVDLKPERCPHGE